MNRMFDFTKRHASWLLFEFAICFIATQTLIAQNVSNGSVQREQLPIELTTDNYGAWREYIQPDDSDFVWQRIQWHQSLKDGVLAANRENKPVLLWTMNGHPFGCT